MRSGFLRAVDLLAVREHRASVVALDNVAVRTDAGVVARLGERVLEAAQPVGREIEGFHVHTRLPQGPQRGHVDHLPATGLRLLVVVLDFGGGRGREHLLGHRCLLMALYERLDRLTEAELPTPATDHRNGGEPR
ncbi:hypothetical protein AB0E62_36530 [Streptomyces sp. NPDC038707]|uniref:hypothetical protein n=1 Tax=Streptomyces sp. NPDC038707 TaxID=3154329 RepID=UPI0033E97B31